jgi:ABC-type branched-subunit amino acid transport system ATPase component
MRTVKVPKSAVADARSAAVAGDVLVAAGPAEVGHEPRPGLDVRDLRAGYGELQVLHGIDIAAPAHRLTAVFGANGSGKSTLCSVLAGLLPAQSGSIAVNGHQLGNSSGADRMDQGVFVVTESRAIFPAMTVEENLLVSLGTKARVEEALQQTPALQVRRQVRAGMLSGGEQQLLAMAPALVIQPKVLIADEPCLGLAPLARKAVLDVCQTLRDRGTVVVLTEERPGDVFEIADDVIFMHLGRIAWTRPKCEVRPQELIDSYLSTPAPF